MERGLVVFDVKTTDLPQFTDKLLEKVLQS
jgi:hypothetical protein